jgi:hypothetical protein
MVQFIVVLASTPTVVDWESLLVSIRVVMKKPLGSLGGISIGIFCLWQILVGFDRLIHSIRLIHSFD